MYFTHTKDGRTLTAALHGEIDHHSAKTARTQLDLLIERENPKVLRMELADIGFCDSSGLGFIMGRLKKMNELGGELMRWSTQALPSTGCWRCRGWTK